jgi:hypothetical protein
VLNLAEETEEIKTRERKTNPAGQTPTKLRGETTKMATMAITKENAPDVSTGGAVDIGKAVSALIGPGVGAFVEAIMDIVTRMVPDKTLSGKVPEWLIPAIFKIGTPLALLTLEGAGAMPDRLKGAWLGATIFGAGSYIGQGADKLAFLFNIVQKETETAAETGTDVGDEAE